MINAIRIIWNMLVFQMNLKKEFLGPLIYRKFFSEYTYWGYKFIQLNEENEEKLNSYIEKKARELAKSENIKIFNVPYEEMNEKEKDKEHWAVGLFIF